MILEGFKPPKSGPFPPILTFFNIQYPIFAYCGTIVVTAWFSLCYIVSSVWYGMVILPDAAGTPLCPYFAIYRPIN